MSNPQGTVFVLWADRFEEMLATAFIVKLREAGLRVRLVSLSVQRAPGAHGLAFVPDLTLEEALPLAGQALAVIIPCNSAGVSRLAADPRLYEFFARARSNDARFVVGPLAIPALVDLDLMAVPVDEVTTYADDEAVEEFAGRLAGTLQP